MSEIITALIGAAAGITIAVIQKFFPRKRKKKGFQHRIFAQLKEWKDSVDFKVKAKNPLKEKFAREVLKLQFDFAYQKAKEMVEKVQNKSLALERESVHEFLMQSLRIFREDLQSRAFPKTFIKKYFSWRFDSVQLALGNIKNILDYHPFDSQEEVLFAVLETLTHAFFHCYFDVAKTLNQLNGELEEELLKLYKEKQSINNSSIY